jgi:selenocysteine-specific elongation factor
MTAIRQVIVGTAGHIDHGKSALVKALTGIDPDRLAEEQERGMTIDLGFAPYRHASGELVGIIDVPGHERFLKNMVAGATSVDVVLLVVAADDGVMPQTREHLAVLQLLGVTRGLVALNKSDLVDPSLLELVQQDVAALLAETPLREAPVVPVSALTGAGLPELRAALDALVDAVPPRSDDGPFRLPVQRVFSKHGHGTVVTGVPVSGRVEPGDELELVGTGRTARVRGVQAYGAARQAGRAGHSTALNVTGLDREDVHRGDVLATPGVFAARRRLAVHYRHVAPEPVRNGVAIRLHVGTSEVPGTAVLLAADELARGEESFLQLRLDAPVVAAPGDRYLLRHASAPGVLGGGTVLAAADARLKRFKERVLGEARERLAAQGDPARLAAVVLAAAGRRGLPLPELALEVGVPAAELRTRLASAVESGALLAVGAQRLLDGAAVEELLDELHAALGRLHAASPLLDWADVAALRREVEVDEELLALLLARDKRFEAAPGGRVRKAGWRSRLTEGQRQAREALLAALRAGGSIPPAPEAALGALPAPEARALLAALRAAGEIVPVGEHWFAADTLAALREKITAHGRARGGAIDIPALRDELATTRRYLIPLLEHFDATGLTVRHGDRRTLRHVEGAT